MKESTRMRQWGWLLLKGGIWFSLVLVIAVLAFSTTSASSGGITAVEPQANGSPYYIYLPLATGAHPSELEVTQAVQQPDNSVMLISNRTTYVRFTVTSATSYAGVNAYLHGTQGGSLLPGSPIAALNNPRTLEASANRADLNDTFNFLLPAAWTSGTVELWGSAENAPDADERFDVVHGPISFTFNDYYPLGVTVIPIAYTCSSGGPGTTTPVGPFNYLIDLTSRIYPVPSINLTEHGSVAYSGACTGGVPDPTYASGPPYDDSDWERMLGLITSVWQAEGSPNNYYYGLVDIDCSGGCISGLGWYNLKAAVGFNGIGPSHDYADETHSHEVGHNHLRQHAPGCGASGPDPSYPYINGSGRGIIGDDHNPNYGFDIGTPTIYEYTDYSDIMGYCSPSWISDYTYAALYAWEDAQASMAPNVVDPGKDALLLSGWLEADGSVHLQPVFRLSLPATAIPSGDYTLLLLDGDGNPLSTTSFGISSADVDRHGGSSAGAVQGFYLTIPYVSGIEQIEVSKASEVLGKLQSKAPTLTSPQTAATPSARLVGGDLSITWSGWSGASYLVRISLDSGLTWQTIAFNQLEPKVDLQLGDINLDLVRIEILSSDGIHTERIEIGVADLLRLPL